MNNYVNILNEMQRENNRTLIEPPPHELLAKMARYIVHKSGKITIDDDKKNKQNSNSFKSTNWLNDVWMTDWTALSTISTHDPIVGYPFANIFSVSDGPIKNSKGTPYFYLTDMEISVQDLKVNKLPLMKSWMWN